MKDQWIAWLEGNQRHFFYGVTIVVATFFIAFQIFGKLHKSPSHSYLSANQAFEKWMHQGEAFEKLEKAIQDRPELAAKFGALIADKFISQNEGEKAHLFAQDVFQRVLKQTPEHVAFAECSLLIATGNLREALILAASLKERFEEDSLLHGFNSVRIASLCRALELPVQELEELEELEEFLNVHSDDAAQILVECFSEGNKTLRDYVVERKKACLLSQLQNSCAH